MSEYNRERVLDFTALCLEGTDLLDGQHVDGLNMTLAGGLFIREPLDVHRCFDAIRQLQHETDSLRVRFLGERGAFYYEYADDVLEAVPVIDAKGATVLEREAYAKQKLYERSQSAWKRGEGAPFACAIVRISETEFFLGVYLDHAIADGHSTGILLQRLMRLYTQRTGVRTRAQAGRELSEFVRRRRDPEMERKAQADAVYWKREMAGFVEPSATLSAPRKEPVFFGHPECLTVPREPLQAFAKRHKITMGALLLGLYHQMIRDVFGAEESAVTYLSTDRNSVKDWDLIAPVAKPLIHRQTAGRTEDPGSFFRESMRIMGENMRHKDAHISAIGIGRFGMNYMNHTKPFLQIPGVEFWMPAMHMDNVNAEFLLLRIQELPDTLKVEFICNPYYFEGMRYTRCVHSFGQLLKDVSLAMQKG